MTNVLSQSVPGGLMLVLNILAVYLFRNELGIVDNQQVLTSMLVLTTTFTGMILLLKICMPLDAFRGVLVVAVFMLSLGAIAALGKQFGITHVPAFLGDAGKESLDFTQTLFIITIVLASYGITSIIVGALKKIKL